MQHLQSSRLSLAIVAGLIGALSLAITARASWAIYSFDEAKATQSPKSTQTAEVQPRLALLIGNGHYPDAAEPLYQPINDASALASALSRDGFDVDVVEDATRNDMLRAVDRLMLKIKYDSMVLLFFGGYGIQSGRESYMVPIDAAIWRENDVRREGISVEAVLDVMRERGAKAKLVVLDASRRNPFERRFRSYSHGLAPINVPENALILSSDTPGKVADDAKGEHSVLVTELLKNFNIQGTAQDMFSRTRDAIARTEGSEHFPTVSSSLSEDIPLVDRPKD